MRFILISFFLLFHLFGVSQIIFEDLDEDNMPDDWELQNGLDPSDPLDAFLDWDCDHILNLHEYYLRSSPIDFNSPFVVEISNSDLSAAINDSFKNLQSNTSIVFRLASGRYTISEEVWVNKKTINSCIQGGWDNEFENYSPEENITTVGQGEFSRNFKYNLGNTRHGAFVMDGLKLEGLSHDMFFINSNSKSEIAFNNCEFVHFGDAWSSNEAVIRFFADENSFSEIDFTNCTFANNYKNGINFRLRDQAAVNCRIINCTMSNMILGNSSFAGIGNAIIVEGDAANRISFELINSIFWNNENKNIRLDWDNEAMVDVRVLNSIFDFALNDEGIDFANSENNFNEDPLFVSPMTNNFNLLPESVCINGGVIIGLSYNGESPDIGAKEFGIREPISKSNAEEEISIYPNPCSETLSIKFGVNRSHDVTLDLYNEDGRFVQNIYTGRLVSGQYEFTKVTSDWDNGVYLLKFTDGLESEWIKLIKL